MRCTCPWTGQPHEIEDHSRSAWSSAEEEEYERAYWSSVLSRLNPKHKSG